MGVTVHWSDERISTLVGPYRRLTATFGQWEARVIHKLECDMPIWVDYYDRAHPRAYLTVPWPRPNRSEMLPVGAVPRSREADEIERLVSQRLLALGSRRPVRPKTRP